MSFGLEHSFDNTFARIRAEEERVRNDRERASMTQEQLAARLFPRNPRSSAAVTFMHNQRIAANAPYTPLIENANDELDEIVVYGRQLQQEPITGDAWNAYVRYVHQTLHHLAEDLLGTIIYNVEEEPIGRPRRRARTEEYEEPEPVIIPPPAPKPKKQRKPRKKATQEPEYTRKEREWDEKLLFNEDVLSPLPQNPANEVLAPQTPPPSPVPKRSRTQVLAPETPPPTQTPPRSRTLVITSQTPRAGGAAASQ